LEGLVDANADESASSLSFETSQVKLPPDFGGQQLLVTCVRFSAELSPVLSGE
jgi:hypothetical protein